MFDLPELKSMSDSLLAKLTDIRHIGDDIRYTYQLNRYKK
jgi:riboflavin biosynthesis pyrimidine reductase